MRPTYETALTMRAEARIASAAAEAWGCRFVKLKRSMVIDFAMLGDTDEVLGVIECKERRVAHNTYESVIVGIEKAFAFERFERRGIPGAFVFEFTDGIHVARYDDVRAERVGFAGRADRGDWQDMEPCLMVPAEAWRPL